MHRTAIIVIAALAAAPVRADAAPSCAAECISRMAECRASRCNGLSRKACRDVCRAVTGCRAGGARTRTLASVVTECRTAGGEWSLKQRLEIKRGDCPPITVMELAGVGTAPDSLGLCELYGRYRFGPASVSVGPFQRIGISPDGTTILFEINAHNAVFAAPAFDVPEEGIFAVRSDGSGLRRLGPGSREKPYKGPVPAAYPPGFNLITVPSFHFDRSGRFVVFGDRGPGLDGTDAGQLVVIDLATGERGQVTALVAAAQFPPEGADVFGTFIDDDTIYGGILSVEPDGTSYGVHNFFVRRDGTGFRPFEIPVPVPGAHVVTNFEIAGVGQAFGVALPRNGTEPVPGPVIELFFRKGEQLLQLTRFGRTDTLGGVPVGNGSRILFTATADPFGTNSSNTCNLFSIDRFGDKVRQLTEFGAVRPTLGCGYVSAAPACWVGALFGPMVDPATGTILIESSCDPFGLTPVSDQYFAMRPDGSGLRQLTNYRGMQVAPDGTITVELPGPTAYPGRTF